MYIRILFSIILIFIVFTAFSQKIDYNKIRYVYIIFPSNDDDTLSLQRTIKNLETIDTNNINRHIEHYYTDVGKAYWLLAHGINKDNYNNRAFNAYNSALFHRSNDPRALWFFALWYYYHNDCRKGKDFMDMYKRHSHKKNWNKECMAFAEAQCQ